MIASSNGEDSEDGVVNKKQMIASSNGEDGEDGVVNEGGLGVEWSAYRPVWVRYRSMDSFPSGYHHPSIVGLKIPSRQLKW